MSCFYTPVVRRDVLCYGVVHPCVRPSGVMFSGLFFTMDADIKVKFGHKLPLKKLQIQFALRQDWVTVIYFTAKTRSNSFPDFFSLWMQISSWILNTSFLSRSYRSSLHFIQIWSLWPTLQPKVGQTVFWTFFSLWMHISSWNLDTNFLDELQIHVQEIYV